MKVSLETVYPTIGIDGKRYEKAVKGGKRLEKMGIDGSLIREYGVSCVANAHVLLNRKFPYVVGSWLVSELFLDFVSKLAKALFTR